jgi:hypothetical protein
LLVTLVAPSATAHPSCRTQNTSHCRHDDVPLVIAVAGRFDMGQTPRSRYSEEQWAELAASGATQWVVGGRSLTVRQADMDERARLDMGGERGGAVEVVVEVVREL